MQWVKQTEKIKRFTFLFIFIVLFYFTHLPEIAVDEINPDAVNWHFRSEQFVVALKSHQWLKTYQHYHPGVTLMWIMGPSVELLKQLSPNDKSYSRFNFETFHFVSKFSLITVELILFVIVIFLLSRFLGFFNSYLAVLLIAYEPFFFGNSRILHMDVLLALFLFIGLIISYLNCRNFSFVKGMLAGIFFTFSFLTKSVGVGGLVFSLIFGSIITFYITRNFKKTLLYLLSILLPFLISLFLFFPAMWAKPFWVLQDIFKEAVRIGVRNGHGQIFLGEYSRDPGALFYPLTLLIRSSPVLLFGLFLFFFFTRSSKENADIFSFLGLFYLSYFIIMIFPSKKIDRYMIPIYPFLSLVSYMGIRNVFDKIKILAQKITYIVLAFISIGFFIIYANIYFFPYNFFYTNPFFGSFSNVNKLIALKSFGFGVHDLKNFILNKYGYYPRLGFIDTKPMRVIYMNSRIFDIRVNGTSDYDILVLALNEDMPEKITDSSAEFELDSTVYLYGLPYWRIYVKEDK